VIGAVLHFIRGQTTRRLLVVGAAGALALTGCGTKIQKLSGFHSAVGFATLTRSPTTVDFGDVTVHATSAPSLITFKNEVVGGSGAGSINCAAPTLSDPLNFTLGASTCATLAQGASCTAQVFAAPTVRGTLNGNLSLSCTDSRGSTQSVTSALVVNGIEIVLTVSPMSFDFGPVKVGTNSTTADFTFGNTGNSAGTGCSIPAITDNVNFTLVAQTCNTNNLGAGASCTASIRANPGALGLYSTTLSRTCIVGGVVSTTTNLITVTGVQPSLAWNPLTFDFGNVNVGANSGTHVFTLSNTGGAAATTCGAPVLSNTTDFFVTLDNCGTSDLAALVGNCTVTLRGNPASTGTKTATLSRTCTYGGTASTTANQITVAGVSASLAWTPLTHDFGNVNVAANSGSQIFTLTNSGGSSATGCSAPTLSDAVNFTVTADTCAVANLAGSGGTCTVTVKGNPATAGAKTATLSRFCSFGGTASTTANQIVVNGIQPVLDWTPLTFAFGNINVGSNSANQTFTLTNSGTAAATGCSAPTITDSTNFTITSDSCAAANLGASSLCTISVQANPTTSGAKATTVSRTCTFGGVASTTTNQITVSGVQPSLAWTPLTQDFGNVNVGSSSGTQVFTLTNAGTASATGCSAPSITDVTNFTITADTCGTANLAGSGATCTVTVKGNPTSAGAKSTTLSRTCTFGGSPTTTANQIVVNGTSAVLAWAPLTQDFGNINVGSSSGTQVFTLTNSGTASATGCSAPAITDVTNFTITADTCGTANLAGSSATCTVTVKGNPTTSGAKSTTLSRTCTFGGVASTTANQILVNGIAPVLAWAPLTFDFGNINLGSSSGTQVFTLTNSGTATATGCSAPSITDTTNFTITADTCGAGTLAGAGATCTVTVKGNPTTNGAKSTTLSRTCTFGGTPSTTANQILVNGTSASLAWTPLTQDFGNVNVGSNSGTQVFTLTNAGSSSATGCSAPAITDTTNFTITADTCGTANLAGSSATCTVTVKGNPTTSGAKSTTLSRNCTFGGLASTTANQILVNGIQPSLAWTPLTYDFGNIDVGSNSTAQAFTLTNSGAATATGCSASTLTDATNFSITADTCGTANLAGSNTTCTVTVRANPTAQGAQSTTLSRTCTFGGTTSTTNNQITTNGQQVNLAFDILTHNYGNVNTGTPSATQVYTLTNLGNKTATGCSAPALSNSTDFEITADTCGVSTLAGSASCTVTVRAYPQSTGAKSSTLSRTCSVGGTPQTTTNGLTTNSISPSLAWSPMTKDFGNIDVGANSGTQVFTLSNSGAASASGCSAPSITDTTNFTITADTCGTSDLIALTGSCTVTVKGNPTTSGAKNTTLSRVCSFGGTPSTTANQIIVTGVVPVLAWTPLTNAFGSINVGSSSATATFTLTNSGVTTATGCSAPTISDVTNFTLSTDTCGTANLAGSNTTCTIKVAGNPTSVGLKTATLSRTCTFGGTVTTTTNQITVTGVQPSLAWTPLTNDFGNIDVGASSSNFSFTLTNSGAAAATGCSAPTISDATNFTLSSDTCGTANLAASGATCTINVKGNPTTAGAKSATLSRTCTFGGVASTTTNQILVNGVVPSLAWSPLTNNFGSINVGSSSATQTFTLTNSGPTTATGCSAPTIDNTTDFTLSADTCGTSTLAGSGATCTIKVAGNPTTVGAKAATLSRTCTFGGTTTTTANQIIVTGIAPNLAWTPLTNNFGSVNVGSSSATQTFTLTNSGTATATTCSAPTIDNTTDFTLSADTCGVSTLAGSGATCTIKVAGNPATVGAKAATLSRTCTFGGTATTTTNQIIVTGIAPSLAWSPLTNAFGSINVGSSSATQTFTLTNSGTATATTCSAPIISDAVNFTLSADTCGTSTLAGSGATCTIKVAGSPASTGAKTATLSRTCTFGGTSTTTTNQITVTGIAPSLAWSPLTNAFGSVNVGSSSATQTFTLTNSGTATATGCSAPTIDNSTDFTLSTDTCGTSTLAGSGATCTIKVAGNPTTSGLKTATLSRTCTFGGTSTTTANQITVTGIAPVLAWTPLTNNFGNINVGSSSATQTFTLTNSGTATATGCSAPTIDNSTDFTLSTDTCGTSTLAGSGATCTIKVAGNPTTVGAKVATLSRTCTFGGTSTTTTNQIVVTGIAASLAWSPLTFDFGNINVGSNSTTQTFTLTNSGGATATGCSAPSISDTTNFTITTDNCGTNTLAGSSATCTVLVRGNPTTAGAKATTLSRTCTFGGTASTTANQITVNGIQPSLAWSPLTNAFGSVNAGSNTATQTFTLTNAGAATATGCTAPSITDTTNFTITTDNCGTNTLAGSSATCTVIVRGNPTTAGAKATTLSRTCTFGGTASTTANQITVTGLYPTLAWTPLTANFGTVAYNYAKSGSLTFTIANTGTADATGCSAPTLTGANAADFEISIDNCGTSNLVSSANCAVYVRAKPAAAGSKTATLSRTCTFGSTATTTANQITVTSTAGAPTLVARSIAAADFGLIMSTRQSATIDVVLGNIGTASATGCTAPTLGSTLDFTLVSHNCGATLAAGDHCTAKVKSIPHAAGNQSTSLSFACTGASTNITLASTGVGTAYATKISGNAHFVALMSDGTLRYTGLGRNTLGGLTNISTATDVKTGSYFSCALLSGGTVQCVGGNSLGQLGDGTHTDQWGTGVNTGITGTAIAIAAGANHACAVISDGTVQCWGQNNRGQLGDGTVTDRSTPVTVSGLTNAISLYATEEYTCALISGGTEKCWGANTYGTLGDGTKTDSYTPVSVKINSSTNLTGITSLAVHGAGNYVANCSILTGGALYCWGNGGFSQMADGTTNSYVYAHASLITNAAQVALGYLFGCAVLTDQTVKCWGTNAHGQLHDGTTVDRTTPVVASGVSGIAEIVPMGESVCALKSSDHSISCWGQDDLSVFGTGMPANVAIPFQASTLVSVTGATEIAQGDETLCARISDGTAKCWGGYSQSAEAGQFSNVNATTPTTVAGLSGVSHVTAGRQFVCFLLLGGTIKCMGDGGSGQLGDNTGVSSGSVLVNVSGISTATQIMAGAYFACAILSDTTVKCWGMNDHGQVGDGTLINRGAPVTVPGLSNVTALAANADGAHMCALISDGTVKCWGKGDNGELGNGGVVDLSVPTLVSGLTNVASISAGAYNTCAVLTDGSMKCWGDNGNDQVGDGSWARQTTPANVSWYSNVAKPISADNFSCALLTDGRARCWGEGNNGWTGSGDYGGISVPGNGAVFSLTGIVQMTAAGYYSQWASALKSDGTIYSWGGAKSGYVDLSSHPMGGFIP
jgi:alpha-tubulin suppressor-like RCC1 family protein